MTWIDRAIDARLAAKGPQDLRRLRCLVGVASILAAAFLGGSAVAFLTGEPLLLGAILLAAVVPNLAVVCMLKWGRGADISPHVCLATYVAAVGSITLLSGGASVCALFAMILTPLFAGLVAGRTAQAWSLGAVIVVAASWYVDGAIADLPIGVDPTVLNIAKFPSAILLIATVCATMSVYRAVQREAEAEIERREAAIRETNHRHAREQLLRMGEEVERLRMLAGGVAHDFNNLLTSIRGNAEVLRDTIPAKSGVGNRLRDIEAACDDAAQIVDQLYAYAGRSEPRTSVCDLKRLVFSETRLPASDDRVSFVLDSRSTESIVRVDPTQIRRVVLNLLSNARDALGPHGGTVRIRIGVENVGADVLDACQIGKDCLPGRYGFIEVEDDGPGIGPELSGRIFEPFFTTKFAGRGLGLAAVAGIVRNHSGAIRLARSSSGGARFTIYLPEAAERPGASPTRVSSRIPAHARRALVVDDQRTVLDAVAGLLRRCGFDVRTASDGAGALRHAQWCDVAVVDLTMPDEDGVAVLARLREIRPGLPAVLMSGYGDDELAARARQVTGIVRLRKPFRLDTLRDAVAAALGAEDASERTESR